MPFDPVRDAAGLQPAQDVMDTSFYSAPSEVSAPPSSATFDRETPQLVDVSEDTPQEGQRTPTSYVHSSFGFQTDTVCLGRKDQQYGGTESKRKPICQITIAYIKRKVSNTHGT